MLLADWEIDGYSPATLPKGPVSSTIEEGKGFPEGYSRLLKDSNAM
jgi:hypothetical protein